MKKNTDPLKRKYAYLKSQGVNQREIAKQLGVSVQTVTKWKKTLPLSHYLIIRDGLLKRLALLMQDQETPVMEIYNLSNALAGVEKTIGKYANIKGLTSEN